MIYNRDYMQGGGDRPRAGVLTWTMVTLLATFLIQNIIETFLDGSGFLRTYVAQNAYALFEGRVWTVVSTGLLHAGLFHLLFNCLFLYIFGREILPITGARRFVSLLVGSVIFGNLVFALVSLLLRQNPAAESLGISAAISAMLVFYACLFPDRQLSFFLIPITFRPKHFIYILGGIDAFFFIFFEVPRRTTGSMPSAMLGGMLAGWLYFKFVHRPHAIYGSSSASIELPAWLKKKKKTAAVAAQTSYKVNVTPPSDIRAEVDRILDKINSKGFGALTAEERRLLDEARDTLNKR